MPALREDICPVERTAEIIGNKWTPLIIRDLGTGDLRFNELEKSLGGISPKTLSDRLKRLERWQIVERSCFAEVPPKVVYSLTPKGKALLPVIACMRDYGSEWLCADENSTSASSRSERDQSGYQRQSVGD